MSRRDRYYIEAAARVLDVLELVNRREAVRLTDVVSELNMIKSSAFRFLYTLERKGYIERAPDGRSFRRRRPQQVGFVSISDKIPFVGQVEQSITQEAERAGLTLLLRHHYFDPALMIAAVDELLQLGIAVLICYNPDEHISHLIADRCAQAQVPVIAITFPVPGARLFGINNYRAGLLGGEGLGEHLEARWSSKVNQVVLLDIPGSSPAQQARMTGMLEGLRKFVHVPATAVTHLHAERESGTAYDLMRDLLREKARSRRIAVLSYNDVNALGALRAVNEAERSHDVRIVSQGGVAEVRTAIRKGGALWGAVAHFPERFGSRLIPLVLGILRGEAPPQTTYTEHVLLTRANLRRYYP
jgi:ribose transport system substrate-binding protein